MSTDFCLIDALVLCGSRLNSRWWYLVLFVPCWGLWFMIGFVQLSLLIMGDPHWGIDIYRLFSYLSDWLGWKVSTCVRMAPVKSFLNQTTLSIVMAKNPNALYIMSIIGGGLLGSVWKSYQSPTRNSIMQYTALGCLPFHLYRWEQCMYNRSPERDQYVRAC